MSEFDEPKIRRTLEFIAKIEPSRKAADRAVRRARDALLGTERRRAGRAGGVFQILLKHPAARFAAAAVLMIGLGYAGGRLSAPKTPDTEQICADVRASLTMRLDAVVEDKVRQEIDRRWDATLQARFAELRDQLSRQFRRDVHEAAVQTLAASDSITDKRMMGLIEQIDAARMTDRARVAEALRQMEIQRLYEKDQLRNGLRTLVARTAQPLQGELD
jgi:hypothetical protein